MIKFLTIFTELVLSVLIPYFTFESVPEKIEWRLGITVSPYVQGKVHEGPAVPMRVKLV